MQGGGFNFEVLFWKCVCCGGGLCVGIKKRVVLFGVQRVFEIYILVFIFCDV